MDYTDMEQTMVEKLLIDYAGDRLLLTDQETGETRAAELKYTAILPIKFLAVVLYHL
ncbi:hypothetical protein ACUN24_15050 [Pedobacter sp. WC2501]|uniref:hypothetical protein n=1 Tax=Pedobacter sp. WC2501 TaxID=3461400 RepID=UPI004045ABA0